MKTTTNITMKTTMVYNLGMAKTCTAARLCHCFLKSRPIADDRTSSQGRLLDTVGIHHWLVVSTYPSEKYMSE